MKIKTLDQLYTISKTISEKIEVNDNILLFGELGVGKTTFARQLINYLQKKNNLKESHVLSPTFNIVYNYDVKLFQIMHYDLYRIKTENEVKELGIFENIKEQIKIIEWPEIISNKVLSKLELHFSYDTNLNYRNLNIKGYGKWKKFKLDEI